ncbi:MAG: V-type ATP synthase subunit D [Clostridiales bacterium]|nr:V-type ATP synthase subunit D [Clostridiales bacterium]
MARLNVNPTRMELTRLKKRLRTAQRGHKLLKDKRDELMKQFLEMVRQNRALRRAVEEKLMRAHGSFVLAAAAMSEESLAESLMCPRQTVSVEVSTRNVMSVNVPKFDFQMSGDRSDIYPYGFGFTSGELDAAVFELGSVLTELLELAQMEKAAELMSDEIEKTRRRVNALEYATIPNLQETIRYITMKLEENERGNITRLMKVKDMMIAEQIAASRARTEKAAGQ